VYHEAEQDCVGWVFESQHEAAVCLLTLIPVEPLQQLAHAVQVNQQRRIRGVPARFIPKPLKRRTECHHDQRITHDRCTAGIRKAGTTGAPWGAASLLCSFLMEMVCGYGKRPPGEKEVGRVKGGGPS